MLMNHNDTSVAAMAGPKDVAEKMVRVVCDRVGTWRFGVCSLKCQNGTAEITSQNATDRTRRVETTLRNTSRYSHNSFGSLGSDVKQAEKQIRATILHTLMTDYKFDSDRLAAQTIEHYTANADEQWSFFKLMSKDGYGEVVRFSELSWFHSIDKHTKLAEQWKEIHWTVKLKRAEEQLFAVKSVNHEFGTGRRKSRDEQWNLDRSRHLESKVITELNTTFARQKYITIQALDKHRRTSLRTRRILRTEARALEHQSRFGSVWIKELAEAEIASRTDDGMSSGPDVSEIESWMSMEATELLVATEGVNADQVVERDSGASRQLDESQLHPMDVSQDQNDTTVATKQRTRTPSTANNAEEDGKVGLRNFDGHSRRGSFQCDSTGGEK